VLRIEADLGKLAARLTRRALGLIHSSRINQVLNSSLEILTFALFGVIALLGIIETILCGTWDKTYFTTGLLMFQRRSPVEPQHDSVPSCSQLETHFHSNWTRSLVFHPIAANTYGFREKLLEFRLAGSSPLMHGMVFFDSENREVVVKGFSNWFTVWFSLLWLGSIGIAVVSVQGYLSSSVVVALGIAILVFGWIMGWFYWKQYSLYSNVARFASEAWSKEYSADAAEA
jgi:hypothetical protein